MKLHEEGRAACSAHAKKGDGAVRAGRATQVDSGALERRRREVERRRREDARAKLDASPYLRAENEDDDGYDPYSDRRPEPEPLFERDPWS